eukprot:SAG25_NODE_5332_length_671_cov_1.162587_1_plen_169_part_01
MATINNDTQDSFLPYRLTDPGYDEVIRAATVEVQLRARLYSERVVERQRLQQLIQLHDEPASELALDIKQALADAWKECGERRKARGMLRWLQETYRGMAYNELDLSTVQDDLAELGSTTEEEDTTTEEEEEEEEEQQLQTQVVPHPPPAPPPAAAAVASAPPTAVAAV